MQHDAALFLPAAITGSHVGPRECHTSGRILPIRFQAWVAAQRHMGFEMDLRALSAAEASVLRDVTAWWKDNRDWLLAGDIARLDSHDPDVCAEMVVAPGGGKFVVMAGQLGASRKILPRPLCLVGLDPEGMYRVALRDAGENAALSRNVGMALKTGPMVVSGQALMARGVTLPTTWPATMWVLEGARL